MMLNGDDNDLLSSCFVDDAVGKSMYQATSSALREWCPSVWIILDARYGLSDFVGEFRNPVPRAGRCNTELPLRIPLWLRGGK
jgi:hypothetical protein